jgi:uncharacterized protein YjiS (DUF1127 family)
MNRFVTEFLDAPLLIERLQARWRQAAERHRLASELYSMNDRELADLRLSRADIPHTLHERDQAA